VNEHKNDGQKEITTPLMFDSENDGLQDLIDAVYQMKTDEII
jgi:hypothetical protein